MRTTTAAWFLPVSLAAALAAVTNVSGSAYQAPGSPGPDVEATAPGTSGPSQPADVAAPRPAARASIPSPVRSGSVQQVYSTAWPYLNSTPTGRSAYGGTGSTSANMPFPPTGRATANRYPTPFGSRGGGSPLTPQAAAGVMGSRSSARTTASSKPFSGYSPRSGISPYMNLFRTDNDFGGIDNYTTLVKPMLQQRQINQQAQWDLRSLQSKSGAQGMELRNLNQRTDVLQGTYQPNRFKNYFNYYPGLER